MKNSFFKDHTLHPIKVYKETGLAVVYNFVEIIKYLFYCITNLIIFIAYPVVYPVLLLVAYLWYPFIIRKKDKRIKESMNRMFPNKDKKE